MRLIPLFFFLAAAAFGLAGCAAVDSQITQLATTLSSPAATQAAANLKAGAQAIACDFSAVANATAQIADAVEAGGVKRDAQTALVVSNIVCTSLGGTPMGTVIVPAS
jgi:hypothetical protein